MATLKNLFNNVYKIRIPFLARVKTNQCACSLWNVSGKRFSSIYEPDGLDYVPEIAEYDELNIRLRGYDYVILESFAKYVKRLCLEQFQLGIDSWPVPPRTTKIQTFKPKSSQVEETFNFSMYERTIQVQNLPNTVAPILFEVIQHNLPEGVQLTVKEPDEEEQEFRYVPDMILQELQSQIDEIDQAKEDRKKK